MLTGYHYYVLDSFIGREKMSYPDAVFLLVLFPVASCVTEHQAITRHPVRASVSSLRGHCCNLHSVSQVHLEPLLSIGICWGPTASSWKKIREKVVVTSHMAATFSSQRETKWCAAKMSLPPKVPCSSTHGLISILLSHPIPFHGSRFILNSCCSFHNSSCLSSGISFHFLESCYNRYYLFIFIFLQP